MTKVHRAAPLLLVLVSALLGLGVCLTADTAAAADRNKCGCYKNAQGTCFCDKKAKCGCPGDCEPKGCEAAREKTLQKEIDAETKKAADADRKHTAVKTSGASKGGAQKDSEKGGEKAGKDSGDEAKSSNGGGKKLTAAQTKQLVKLLDLYFQENPDARSRNVEDVRNRLSQSR
jgi:hypothetical protein